MIWEVKQERHNSKLMDNAHILTPQNEVHEIEQSLEYPTFELYIFTSFTCRRAPGDSPHLKTCSLWEHH